MVNRRNVVSGGVTALCAGAFLSLPRAAAAQALEVRGAGATLPARIYAEWASQYAKKTPLRLSYTGTGSSDGVKQIIDRSVDFGGSDVPVPEAQLKQHSLVQFPTVVGGIVPALNLPGVSSGDIRLTGAVLADIFLGQITVWNDDRIRKLNPGVALPGLPIRPVVRDGRSASTLSLTEYLNASSPAWTTAVGKSDLPKWPVQAMRAKSTEDLVAVVRKTPGALGYAGFDALFNGQAAWALLSNASGGFVQPSPESFRAAVSGSEFGRRANEYAGLVNQAGLAWPITIPTFILVPANPVSKDKAESMLKFLYWAYQRGDAMVTASGFAALPVSLQARVAPRFGKVLGPNGQTLNYVT